MSAPTRSGRATSTRTSSACRCSPPGSRRPSSRSSPGGGRAISHAFYGIGDGGALAFFNFADPEAAAAYQAKKQPTFIHIALAVTDAAQRAIKQRLEGAKLPVREVDHGYCKSIYVQDPDGLLVEFTSDPPDAGDIAAHQRTTAHETLRRWQAGDRTVNNDIRPHR